jgi:hypothetical protein
LELRSNSAKTNSEKRLVSDGAGGLEMRGFGGLEVRKFDGFKDLEVCELGGLEPHKLMDLSRMDRFGKCCRQLCIVYLLILWP